MAKNDLTIVVKKGIIKNITDLFDYNKYASKKLVSVIEVDMIQVVSSSDKSHYEGYVIFSKESYNSLMFVDEMYPLSTVEFFETRKEDMDIFNLHYTRRFGKSTVKEVICYLNDRYFENDIFILEDKGGLVYSCIDFVKLIDNFI